MSKQQRRLERRKQQINQVRLLRAAKGVTGVLAAGVMVYAIALSTSAPVLKKTLGASKVERQLVDTLGQLQSAWRPTDQERILKAAPAHRTAFAGPLHQILRAKKHPLLETAVRYAGALGAPELRPTLVSLTVSGHSKPTTKERFKIDHSELVTLRRSRRRWIRRGDGQRAQDGEDQRVTAAGRTRVVTP